MWGQGSSTGKGKAAVRPLADSVGEPPTDAILPAPLDRRVAPKIVEAVRQAANKSEA